MHVYFSGIGGSGANSIALLAKQAGYEVSGSDAQPSTTIDYLKKRGITDIHIGQTTEAITEVHRNKPIGQFVYTSALPMTDPNHPELMFCKQNNIPALKHDEFLASFISSKNLMLVAIAGTHGKSTTTAMTVWLATQLGIKASWVVGAKMAFADSGHFNPEGRLFIYEADEFDKKFLSFRPHTALIAGVDWDHPDIYPSREKYYQAFKDFLGQSEKALAWKSDLNKLGLRPSDNLVILDDKNPQISKNMKLAGLVNRQDAWLVAQAANKYMEIPLDKAINILNGFPGLSRRFEEIVPNLYTDYAHTPPKIRGALQMAHEAAGQDIVVVYEGLHNTRQHFIKDELANLFDDVKQLYIVPSYLAREDENLKLLSPTDLLNMLSIKSKDHAEAAKFDDNLKQLIQKHISSGDLVLCLSAGGASSLDEWLRKEFA